MDSSIGPSRTTNMACSRYGDQLTKMLRVRNDSVKRPLGASENSIAQVKAMKMKKAILVGFVLLVFGKAAFGQHLGELSANYSYMHYVPVDNLPSINLNGG